MSRQNEQEMEQELHAMEHPDVEDAKKDEGAPIGHIHTYTKKEKGNAHAALSSACA